MKKLIFADSFDFGIDGPLATLADNPDTLKKCASSDVVEKWGEIKPQDGHSLVHLIALGSYESTGPNRNGDAFKTAMCETTHPTFITKGALYRNHKSDPKYKEGHVVKTAYNKDMGRIELLVAAQHDKCADWLGDLEKGNPVSFSMGFSCDPGDNCSICDHMARNRSEYCEHVKKGALHPYGMNRVLPDGRKCFVYNDHGYFNDISRVPVGADAIARDLRKVAALGDDEVVSGADLAEMYSLSREGADLDKVALCRKLSAMEKRIQMVGIRRAPKTRSLNKVAVNTLRQVPVQNMFSELLKVSAILPLTEFYSLILGSEYADHEQTIKQASAMAATMFTDICNDGERMADVCSNTTYTPASKKYASVLNHSQLSSIAFDFSILPEFSLDREIKTAAYESDIHDDTQSAMTQTQQAKILVDQYAAYKIAALDHLGAVGNDTLLLSATINA